MAEVAPAELVNIAINDVELQVPKGELVVEAVGRLGLKLPIFCYHPRLKTVGMCRMCLVEVGFKQPDGSLKKMPKPQAGCTLPASEGLSVYTDTESIHRDRRGVLEFLLINHPLDCPICDRGGECPLQNNTLDYGPSTSRFVEIKRHQPKAFPLSKHVTLDLERCIQCGRCVRFTEEISGDSQLAMRFRGAAMQPGTFELSEFESKYSGNTIEICPVGALTSTDYRFRARPWDFETLPGVCTVCSNGCNLWVDYRSGKYVRVKGRTNEAVNEEWTCDRGKFGHDWLNSPKRLSRPLIRVASGFREATWSEAYTAILEAFQPGGNEVAALVNPVLSNEGLYLLQKLFRTVFRSNNLDHRWTRHLPARGQRLQALFGIDEVQSALVDYERAPSTLVFATNPADELPMVHLRLRKAWFHRGARIVVASDRRTDLDEFAHLVIRYRPGTESILAKGLLRQIVDLGKASVPQETDITLADFDPARVERDTDVPAPMLRAAAEMAAGAPIVCSRNILNVPEAQEVIESLALIALGTGGAFNLCARESNEQGALELGILPDEGPGGAMLEGELGLGTRRILEAAASGALKALWLLEANPLALTEADLASRALENVPFLVYQATLETDAMAYASVVLPIEAPMEQDGAYTNVERRVQRMRQIVVPPDDAKPAWRIFSEAMLRARPMTPAFNAAEVMQDIIADAPLFEAAAYGRLEGEGGRLGQPPAETPKRDDRPFDETGADIPDEKPSADAVQT